MCKVSGELEEMFKMQIPGRYSLATALYGLGKGRCRNSKYLAKVLQLGTYALIPVAAGQLSLTAMCPPYMLMSFCSGVSDMVHLRGRGR